MSTPPPGWYPDPGTPGQVRWWDGTAWTEHAQRQMPAPTQAPWRPPPGYVGSARSSARNVSWLFAVVAVVLGVGLVAVPLQRYRGILEIHLRDGNRRQFQLYTGPGPLNDILHRAGFPVS